MVRAPIALCLFSAAALALVRAAEWPDLAAAGPPVQRGSGSLQKRILDLDWIRELRKDLESPLLPSLPKSPSLPKLPSLHSKLAPFPSKLISPGKKSSTTTKITEIMDDKGTRRATTTTDHIGKTRTTVIEESSDHGHSDSFDDEDDFLSATRPMDHRMGVTRVITIETADNNADFSGNTGKIINSGTILLKRAQKDPHFNATRDPTRTTTNTKKESNVNNDVKMNGNRGTIDNSGNVYGQYDQCTIVLTQRGFSDGLALGKEQLEKRGGHHHHHHNQDGGRGQGLVHATKTHDPHHATSPYNPTSSRSAQVPAYGGQCVCNCGTRKRSLSEKNVVDPDAVALYPFVEPTCSVWKTDEGAHFLAGSCDHSTLVGRELSTIFPSM